MQKERLLASEIIDIVEDAIRKAHPKVDSIGSHCKGNTLLYGEKYYALEDILTDILQSAKSRKAYKNRKIFNPSKRKH